MCDGQLSDAEATLYTVPALEVAYVKTIALSNRGAGDNVVALYIQHDGGASRRIFYATLSADETILITTPITLAAADVLRGEADTAAEVDYAVFGAEDLSNAFPPPDIGYDIGWYIEAMDTEIAEGIDIP